jgi:hypothetical protein
MTEMKKREFLAQWGVVYSSVMPNCSPTLEFAVGMPAISHLELVSPTIPFDGIDIMGLKLTPQYTNIP